MFVSDFTRCVGRLHSTHLWLLPRQIPSGVCLTAQGRACTHAENRSVCVCVWRCKSVGGGAQLGLTAPHCDKHFLVASRRELGFYSHWRTRHDLTKRDFFSGMLKLKVIVVFKCSSNKSNMTDVFEIFEQDLALFQDFRSTACLLFSFYYRTALKWIWCNFYQKIQRLKIITCLKVVLMTPWQ